MQDELKELGDIVQATFGLPVTITYTTGGVVESRGIFTTERVETGSFEGVMTEMTLVTLDRAILLKRGDKIECQQQVWTVDRKLKDDGYLATWNLHDG